MKILFYLSLIVYATLGLIGVRDPMYIDPESTERVMGKLLILLVVCSILISIGYYAWHRKVFPKMRGKERVSEKIAIAFVALIVSFAFNMSLIKLYNRKFGKQTPFVIKGYIVKKDIEKGTRGRKNYMVTIHDPVNGAFYKLKLKVEAFERLEQDGPGFNKEFTIGSLGIIYRKEI